LRLRELQGPAAAEARRLLRVLFLRHCAMSAEAGRCWLLRKPKRMRVFAFLAIGFFSASMATEPMTASPAKLWLPDLVSTPNSEVRITFSPDGKRMLWGAIGWANGAGGWDVYESVREGEGWSAPKSASFNSAANDFDPSFAPDGSGVYFFSNRPGGL